MWSLFGAVMLAVWRGRSAGGEVIVLGGSYIIYRYGWKVGMGSYK